jgi:hypothetical protein
MSATLEEPGTPPFQLPAVNQLPVEPCQMLSADRVWEKKGIVRNPN